MPVRRRRLRRNTVIPVTPDRFAGGWRLLAPDFPDLVTMPPPEEPSFVVDVARGRDLVALTAEFYRCELFNGEDGPIVRPLPDATAARMVIRLAYQHLGERAIYETQAPVPDPLNPGAPNPPIDPNVDPPTARPVPPLDVRPARASRLVFALADGETIAFSTDGILAAMGRLPMLVHPLATPKPGTRPVLGPGPIVVLPGGVSATLAADGVAVARARAADIDRTDPVAQFRNLRHTRTILATRSGVATPSALPDGAGAPSIVVNGVERPVASLFGRGGLVIAPGRIGVPRPRKRLSRPPTDTETAIEAPWRLVISPSAQGGWTHATAPVGAAGAEHRVELWHTRLGVRDDDGRVDEKAKYQRVVRAIWARDREALPDWENLKVPPHDQVPFRASLDNGDRHMLVRQSAETWPGVGLTTIPPVPVDADALSLSALGARLDLHGRWISDPYSAALIASILRWDHLAPWGRDQYVCVVYPGYLFPPGFRTALVKVTERKMKDAAPSTAGLYQQMFFVPGERIKTYNDRRFPYTEIFIAPEKSPTIDPPTSEQQNTFFWPTIGGARLTWTLHTLDHERRRGRLDPPLIWVAEHFQQQATVNAAYEADPDSTVLAYGQKIAFTPVRAGGDTVAPTVHLKLAGEADGLRSRPYLRNAKVEIPAVQSLSATGPVVIEYADVYVNGGFESPSNTGEVWAKLPTPVTLGFGPGSSSGSDKSGGFIQPNLPVAGISRLTGTVGDVAGMATQQFDPATFLAGALPKLFGLVPLVDLLRAVGLDLSKVPNVVAEAVDRIEGFLADLDRAKATALEAVADAQRLVDRAAGKANDYVQQAQDALAAAQQMEAAVTAAATSVKDTVLGLPNATKAEVEAALVDPPGSLLTALRDALTAVEDVAPKLPPLVRNRLDALAKLLRSVVDAADLIDDIVRFVNGFDPSSLQAQFRYEWRPEIESWPSPAHPFLGIDEPILIFKPEGPGPRDNLVLAVDGRASGKGEMRVDVLAELRDFALLLLPGEPLVRFDFDHLSFKAGSTGKAEVDVVLNDIEFLGILGFIEVLKDLIPFDGFSDPPYLEVSPSGIVAGFSLALPNVAVGVFALSNMSLGADVSIPFLGETVTVGFNFCTRERPFTLQVTFIGGGGWFLIRLSPDGLDVLELGLEAGATLSIDLGVASGSISAMVGVYMRLEGEGGSLTGYFRLRGEVDVLGIISASIELYLELRYVFETGKLYGLARLTIEIEVFIFSGSVTIECERQFAGSKGDPTFAELMAVEPDGTSEPWSEYCTAFAAAGA
jgi:hypothetical protein